MHTASFPAGKAHVTDLVTFTTSQIHNRWIQSDPIHHRSPLFEEIALKLIVCANEGAEITVSVSHLLGRTTVRFRCPGTLVDLKPEHELDFGGQILAEYRDHIFQSYSNGTNIVTISSPQSSVDVLIPSLCAFGLAVLLSLLLPRFFTEAQITWLVDSVIHPIVQAFIRCIQAFAIPVTFFSLASVVLSLRLAATKENKIPLVIACYAITSMVAIGIGILVSSALFHLGLITPLKGYLTLSDSILGHTMVEFLNSAVFNNLIWPFLSPNPLPMLFLAILTGLAASTFFGSGGIRIRRAILDLNGFFIHILNLIVGTLPFFLFLSLLENYLELGFLYTTEALMLILSFFPSMLLLFLFYALLLRANGISPRRFFSRYRSILWTNYRIGSNVQAIPFNKRALSKLTDLSPSALLGTLRLSSSINMNGNCMVISQGILTLIFYFGVPSSSYHPLTLALIILLLSIGSPNQPGFMLAMVILFSYVGISVQACEVLLIIEVFLGRTYSFLNSLGDIVTVAILDERLKRGK